MHPQTRLHMVTQYPSPVRQFFFYYFFILHSLVCSFRTHHAAASKCTQNQAHLRRRRRCWTFSYARESVLIPKENKSVEKKGYCISFERALAHKHGAASLRNPSFCKMSKPIRFQVCKALIKTKQSQTRRYPHTASVCLSCVRSPFASATKNVPAFVFHANAL